MSGWKKVVFANECDDDGNCPICIIDYADCECPGPTQEDLYVYEERPDGLWAQTYSDRIEELVKALGRLQSEVESLTIDNALLRAENIRLRWEIAHKPEVMR